MNLEREVISGLGWWTINELSFHPVGWHVDGIMCIMKFKSPSKDECQLPQLPRVLPAESPQPLAGNWLPQLQKAVLSQVIPSSHGGLHSKTDGHGCIRPGCLTPAQKGYSNSELISWGPTKTVSQFHFSLHLILLIFSSHPPLLILKPFPNKTPAQ